MDGELRDGCQYCHEGLSCSGYETADLVNLVDDGFWVRRAFHERSMLDCQSEQAQVDSHVSDEVHLHVPRVTLDETLEKKDEFSKAVHVQ